MFLGPIYDDDPRIIEARTANKFRTLSGVPRFLLHCHLSSRPEQMSASTANTHTREQFTRGLSVGNVGRESRSCGPRTSRLDIRLLQLKYLCEYSLSTCDKVNFMTNSFHCDVDHWQNMSEEILALIFIKQEPEDWKALILLAVFDHSK